MKKKVLSVVLASALFAGSAIAASAEVWGKWDSSSKSGDSSDITALAFTKDSYTIHNGDDPKNMNEVLTAYAGDTAIVQEPELEWEISENDLAFELNTDDNKATVAAFENKGSATITVTANDGKVKAFCKVVAAPLVKASGFKFEKSNYTLLAGAYVNGNDVDAPNVAYADDLTVKLVSTPTDAKFSDAQKAAFANMQIALVAGKDYKVTSNAKTDIVNIKQNQVIAISGTGNDEGKFKFDKNTLASVYAGVTNARLVVVNANSVDVASDYATTNGTDITKDENKAALKIDFPAYDSDKSPKTISRDVRASTELGKAAERAGRTGAITIEVGQTADLGEYVKYGPTDATKGKDLDGDWSIDYFNSNYSDDDFAVLNEDKDKVLGVAVGKVLAVNSFHGKEIAVPVNVVARGAKADAPATTEPTTESATLAIGGTYWVESGDANTTWTVDNDNVTILPEVGAGCKVFAKKAGTATVTGTVDGKVVKTVTITIEAAGATTPDVPAEANPSTGDSLLAFLF